MMLYWPFMKILSIDLASSHYRDFGMALLALGSDTPAFITTDRLALEDPPQASAYASALHRFCLEEDVQVLLLDGPQAWRHPSSPIEHMRLCERVLNTPGKTGLPGTAKPRTYLPFIRFSIEVFDQLREHGWSLLDMSHLGHPAQRLAIECFPSYSWRTLGLRKLPAKGRVGAAEIEIFRESLADRTGYKLPRGLTHDQLQAAAVLPVGEALLRGDLQAIIMAGIDPIIEGGTAYEGWIPLPKLR